MEADIDTLGLQYKKNPLPGGSYTLHVDVSESDPRWVHVASLVQEKQALDIYDTVFSSDEVRSAAWLRLTPTFEQGYPQPEKDWFKNHTNYEKRCPACGSGFVQVAPFRLAKEPDLDKHDFMSLYWTYALFATNRVFAILEEHQIRGYDRWPGIINNTNQPSELVSQVYIAGVAQAGLADPAALSPNACVVCGVIKHAYHKRGVLRLSARALLTNVDIQLTSEWFGSGHSAFREILVSDRFAKLILDQSWQGVGLKPIRLV